MLGHLLLGLDVGTTGCKATLCTEEGVIVGQGYSEYPLIRLSEEAIEQRPEDWWDKTIQAVRLALHDAGGGGGRVAAVGVSSQGIAFVPVNAALQPLRRALSWLDTRANEQAQRICSQHGISTIFELTGKLVSSWYVLPKLMWLREHEPDVYAHTHQIQTAHDYITCRLSGQAFTDHTMASGTLLYDVQQQSWAYPLMESYDVLPDMFPLLAWSGSVVGCILPKVAKELGISPKAQIVVGAQDQKCAALGAGLRPGVAIVSLGTAAAITVCTKRPLLKEPQRVPCSSFVRSGEWVVEGVVGTAGASLRWLRDILDAYSTGGGYAAMDRLAAASSAGSGGVSFIPFLGGAGSPHWNAQAKGCFHGLKLSTSAGDLCRAVMEGVALEIADNLQIIERLVDQVQEVRVLGGGARSKLWREILANVTGRSIVSMQTYETANLGACMLAGVGCGMYGSLDEAAASYVRCGGVCTPSPELSTTYSTVARTYRCTRDGLLGGR